MDYGVLLVAAGLMLLGLLIGGVVVLLLWSNTKQKDQNHGR